MSTLALRIRPGYPGRIALAADSAKLTVSAMGTTATVTADKICTAGTITAGAVGIVDSGDAAASFDLLADLRAAVTTGAHTDARTVWDHLQRTLAPQIAPFARLAAPLAATLPQEGGTPTVFLGFIASTSEKGTQLVVFELTAGGALLTHEPFFAPMRLFDADFGVTCDSEVPPLGQDASIEQMTAHAVATVDAVIARAPRWNGHYSVVGPIQHVEVS